MNYFVIRNGQEQGPYSFEDLHRQVADGTVALTDEARGDGADQSVPENPMLVGQILGIATPPPMPTADFQGPLPPRLHWGILLVLVVLSGGILALIWMFVQARYVKKIDPSSPARWWYAGGLTIVIVGGFIVGVDAAISPGETTSAGAFVEL